MVDNDPGSQPIPLQSRDYTALAGCDNVCTNLGKPYPCTAKDLDYPKKRDLWLDQNKKQMLYQRDVVSMHFHGQRVNKFEELPEHMQRLVEKEFNLFRAPPFDMAEVNLLEEKMMNKMMAVATNGSS